MASEDDSTPPSRGQPEAPTGTDQQTNSTDNKAGQAGSDQKKKKRIRHWTAHDRAAHRVFERSRREAFKERLTNLAGLIPALENTDPGRLSKHVVVDESISLHRQQQDKLKVTADQVSSLLDERSVLLEELNRWRHGAGMEPRKPNTLPLDFREPTPQHDDSFQQMAASQVLSQSSNTNNQNFVTSGSDESPLVPDDDSQMSMAAATQMSAFVPPDAAGPPTGISDGVSPDAMPVPPQVGHTNHHCEPITPMGNIWNGLSGMGVPGAHNPPAEMGLDLDGMDMATMAMFDGGDPASTLAFQQMTQGQDGSMGGHENMFYARQPLQPFEPMNYMDDSRLRRT